MELEVRKCTHIKVNGIQCGSPALKTGTRCYFHEQASRRQRTSVIQRPALLPILEDANSIQIALMDIIHDLRQENIDLKVAGKLLYALQIASSNLKHMDLNRQDSVTDLPPDFKHPEPQGIPRIHNLKLPYDGIPDPTMQEFPKRQPTRDCAPTWPPRGASQPNHGVSPKTNADVIENQPPTVVPQANRQPRRTAPLFAKPCRIWRNYERSTLWNVLRAPALRRLLVTAHP